MKRDSKFNNSDNDENDDDDGEGSWQNSYSDLMTDLLAIFVVLLSFAMMKQAMASSISESKQKSNAVAEISVIEQTRKNSIIESVRSYINEIGLSEKLSVTEQGSTQILLRAESSIFFESGSADIKPESKAILYGISKILTKHSKSIKMVRIEGHTDNRPIHTEQFNSNWELSTSRAVNVLRELSEISKIGNDKFSAVGYAEYHPVADNTTESGRLKNRRVDFIIETID